MQLRHRLVLFALPFVFGRICTVADKCTLFAVFCDQTCALYGNITRVIATHSVALQLCNDFAADLATPGDNVTNEAFFRLCPSALFSMTRDGTLPNCSAWRDDDQPVQYMKWRSGEPNNNGSRRCMPALEDCAGFSQLTADWFDRPCDVSSVVENPGVGDDIYQVQCVVCAARPVTRSGVGQLTTQASAPRTTHLADIGSTMMSSSDTSTGDRASLVATVTPARDENQTATGDSQRTTTLTIPSTTTLVASMFQPLASSSPQWLLYLLAIPAALAVLAAILTVVTLLRRRQRGRSLPTRDSGNYGVVPSQASSQYNVRLPADPNSGVDSSHYARSDLYDDVHVPMN